MRRYIARRWGARIVRWLYPSEGRPSVYVALVDATQSAADRMEPAVASAWANHRHAAAIAEYERQVAVRASQ